MMGFLCVYIYTKLRDQITMVVILLRFKYTYICEAMFFESFYEERNHSLMSYDDDSDSYTTLAKKYRETQKQPKEDLQKETDYTT